MGLRVRRIMQNYKARVRRVHATAAIAVDSARKRGEAVRHGATGLSAGGLVGNRLDLDRLASFDGPGATQELGNAVDVNQHFAGGVLFGSDQVANLQTGDLGGS